MVDTTPPIPVEAAASAESVWSSALLSLTRNISPDCFRTWISRLKPAIEPDNVLGLEAPNHFFKAYIDKCLLRDIQAAVDEGWRLLGREDEPPVVRITDSGCQPGPIPSRAGRSGGPAPLPGGSGGPSSGGPAPDAPPSGGRLDRPVLDSRDADFPDQDWPRAGAGGRPDPFGPQPPTAEASPIILPWSALEPGGPILAGPGEGGPGPGGLVLGGPALVGQALGDPALGGQALAVPGPGGQVLGAQFQGGQFQGGQFQGAAGAFGQSPVRAGGPLIVSPGSRESGDGPPVIIGGQHFNPKFTFDNFVVGEPNSLAYHAAMSFAMEEDFGLGILFLISHTGLGKSHLAQALARRFLEIRRRRGQVKYLTFEAFTNEMTRNLNQRTMEDFKRRYRDECDLLMLEDATFLDNKLKVQQELCYTLDYLIGKGKRVVVTSQSSPQSIPRMDQALKSRLASSLVAPINPPDYPTRLAILERACSKYRASFPKPVLEHLAANVKGDVRSLVCCVRNINAQHTLLRRPVTVALAMEIVEQVVGDAEDSGPTLPKIVRLICRAYQLGAEELRSGQRVARIKDARNAGMYLAKQLTTHSLKEIGEAFGRRHSTVINSINNVVRRAATDDRLRSHLDYLTSQLVKNPA